MKWILVFAIYILLAAGRPIEIVEIEDGKPSGLSTTNAVSKVCPENKVWLSGACRDLIIEHNDDS